MTLRKKIFISITGTFVTILLLAGFYIYNNIGRLAKNAIEYYGPVILGVPIKVKSVHISPFSGSGGIKGLVIGNPTGFSEPNLLRLGRADVEINLRSLTSNTIHIYSVEMKDVELTWEGGLSESNVTRVQKHAQNFAASISRDSSSSKKAPATERKFLIDRVSVKGIDAIAHLKGVAGVKLPLPDIEMKDLGKSGKSTIADISSQILSKLTSEVISAISKSTNFIGKGLKSGGDFLHKLFSK